MKYAVLGKTELRISSLALSMCAITGRPNEQGVSRADAEAIVRTAWDGGINFFLTCENDAEHLAERHLASALSDVRDQVVIAKRIGPERQHPRELVAAVEDSLRVLGCDRLDLVLADRAHPRLGPAEVVGTLARLREEGKVRAFGVSRYGPGMLASIQRGALTPHCVAADYNLLFRACEAELLPACRRAQIPVLATLPLMMGLLTGRYLGPEDLNDSLRRLRHFQSAGGQRGRIDLAAETFRALGDIRRIAAELGEPIGDVALAWVAAQPSVSAVAIGASSTLQVRRTVRAAHLALPPAIAEELSRATRRLSEALGRSLDPWSDPPRWF